MMLNVMDELKNWYLRFMYGDQDERLNYIPSYCKHPIQIQAIRILEAIEEEKRRREAEVE